MLEGLSFSKLWKKNASDEISVVKIVIVCKQLHTQGGDGGLDPHFLKHSPWALSKSLQIVQKVRCP